MEKRLELGDRGAGNTHTAGLDVSWINVMTGKSAERSLLPLIVRHVLARNGPTTDLLTERVAYHSTGGQFPVPSGHDVRTP